MIATLYVKGSWVFQKGHKYAHMNGQTENYQQEIEVNIVEIDGTKIRLKEPAAYAGHEVGNVSCGMSLTPSHNYQKCSIWVAVQMPAHVDDILSGDALKVAQALLREPFNKSSEDFLDRFYVFANGDE